MTMRNMYMLCFLVAIAAHIGIANAQSKITQSHTDKVSSTQVSPTHQLAGTKAVDEFIQALEYGREDVQRQAFRTTALYIGIRVFLIVFASLAAFGKNFRGTRFKSLSNWIPIFSLLVAIGTGLDTFMKLGQRRSGHYNYISNVEDIEMQTKRIFSSGAMTLDQLQEFEDRYSSVKAQHRREAAF